jgi:hypothetical protein
VIFVRMFSGLECSHRASQILWNAIRQVCYVAERERPPEGGRDIAFVIALAQAKRDFEILHLALAHS